MKAMVFAAGLGTRLKEETARKPKALVEVGGKPLLQMAIEKLRDEGMHEVVVNVHHFSRQVIDYLQSHDFGIPVHVSDETDRLLDTGGALKKAAPFLSGNAPFLVYNVDVISNLCLQDLIQFHLKSGALATLAVRDRKSSRYFRFDPTGSLTGWINIKTGETKIAVPEHFEDSKEMAFSGIHIANPRLFSFMPEKECFSIIDLYLELAGKELIQGYFDTSETWIDVGKPEQLAVARKLAGESSAPI